MKRTGWWIAVLALTALPVWAQDVVEESPFLLNGREYADPSSGIEPTAYDIWGDTPYRFPDAASCLVGHPTELAAQQAARLDRFNLLTEEELAVCLFRIAARLGSVDFFTSWMNDEGWETKENYVFDSWHQRFGEPITQAGFSWDARANGALYGGTDQQRRYLWFQIGSQATFLFDNQGRVLEVSIGGISRWWRM